MSDSGSRALEPEQVLEVLEERDPTKHPVMTSNRIQEELKIRGIEVTTRTVKNRLDELERSGEVATYKPARTSLYWLPGDFESQIEALPGAPTQPPQERPVRTSGGAEASPVREAFSESEEELRRIFRQTIEEYERKRTRQESAQTFENWGEMAMNNAEAWAKIGLVSALGFTTFFGGFLLFSTFWPAFLQWEYPVIGVKMGTAVAVIGAMMLVTFVSSILVTAGFFAAARTGLALWLEEVMTTLRESEET